MTGSSPACITRLAGKPLLLRKKSAPISGGQENTAGSDNSTVAGGYQNSAGGIASTVSGGQTNTTSDDYSTVGGGLENTASGEYTTVGGGQDNTAIANYAVVSGGQENTANSFYTTVGGGASNTASYLYATVGGGGSNTASAGAATVGGGGSNTASGGYSTVSGGHANMASRYSSTVSGGDDNIASNNDATISGGRSNTASGYSATVAGGDLNAARGHYSLAAGFNAKARHEGSFSWADRSSTAPADSFYSTNDNQFLIRATGGVGIGTNAPQATVEIKMPYGTTDDDYGLLLNAANRRWNFIVGGAHAGSAAFLQLLYKNHDQTSYTPRFTFSHLGRLGIGNANPSHRVEVGTLGNTTNGNGAYVSDTGVWTNTSSRSVKEGFAPVDGEGVLERLAGLPITRWRYKGEVGVEHLGPVAEDFFAVFGLGEDARYIATVDADGVALAAIQGLYVRNQQQQAEIEALRTVLDQLRAEVATLREEAATR